MNRIFTFLFAVLAMPFAFGQNNVGFDASQSWIAYMNVFETQANGGAYAFGSSWGLADVKATADVAGNTLTLQPNFNTYADNPTDPYWVDQSTGMGNKDMEAAVFVEPGASFNGVDLTFSGNFASFTLDQAYSVSVFIKALDPNNGYQDALGGAKIMPVTATGAFSVSATAAELSAGLIIQYGFIVRGVNANPANEAALGSVVIDNNVMTSVSNVENTPSLVAVYPNPANDVLTVSSNEFINKFRVVNMIGAVVLEGNNTEAIDVSQLNAGTYFIEFTVGDKKEIESFIKL